MIEIGFLSWLIIAYSYFKYKLKRIRIIYILAVILIIIRLKGHREAVIMYKFCNKNKGDTN